MTLLIWAWIASTTFLIAYDPDAFRRYFVAVGRLLRLRRTP